MIEGLGLLGIRKEASFLDNVKDTLYRYTVGAYKDGALMRKYRKALHDGVSNELYDFASWFQNKFGRPGVSSRLHQALELMDASGAPKWKSRLKAAAVLPGMVAGSHPVLSSTGAAGLVGIAGLAGLGGDDDDTEA